MHSKYLSESRLKGSFHSNRKPAATVCLCMYVQASHRYKRTHMWTASGGVYKYLCNKEYRAQDEARDGRAWHCHHPSENRTLLGLSRQRQQYTVCVAVCVCMIVGLSVCVNRMLVSVFCIILFLPFAILYINHRQ